MRVKADLDRVIRDGGRVFLFDHPDTELLRILCEEINRLGIVNTEVWCNTDHYFESKVARFLSMEKLNEVLELYRMYDFSDRVSVLSESELHGTLFNYVRTSVLTREELVDALLLQI